MKDVLIPIVFPDYRISVDTPQIDVDLFPWTNFDNFSIRGRKNKISDMGHAGILIINGKTGLSKYYEYGRYDAPKYLGVVRGVIIPDAKVNAEDSFFSSLKPILKKISAIAGHGGRIQGVYIEVGGVFSVVDESIRIKKSQNTTDTRPPYDLTSNSCVHFVKKAVDRAGVPTPWIVDPRPNSYIGEFRGEYPDLDYDPEINRLIIEGKKVN